MHTTSRPWGTLCRPILAHSDVVIVQGRQESFAGLARCVKSLDGDSLFFSPKRIRNMADSLPAARLTGSDRYDMAESRGTLCVRGMISTIELQPGRRSQGNVLWQAQEDSDYAAIDPSRRSSASSLEVNTEEDYGWT